MQAAVPPVASSAATAVVMLHASLQSAAQWDGLAEALGPDYHCLAIDLLGYGAGAPAGPADGYSLARECAAVQEALATQLAPDEPFHLVGHAFGGAVALHLALTLPGRVLSLALFEPLALSLLGPQHPARREAQSLLQALEAFLPLDPPAAAQVCMDYWFGAGSFARLPAPRRALAAAQADKARMECRAVLDDTLDADTCARLDLPACIITGRDSPAPAQQAARLLAQALPRDMRMQVEGGHGAPLTHAARVHKVIAAFLHAQHRRAQEARTRRTMRFRPTGVTPR